jgi:hypothetical protein
MAKRRLRYADWNDLRNISKLVASLLPKELETSIDGAVVHQHQIEHIRRTIIDPKVVTVQEPVRLLSKAPTLEPEPKADLGGLYE